MDLKKLDEVIDEYCSKSGIFKDTIDQVYPMAVNVIKTSNPPIDKLEWSRKFSLEESIKYVFMFMYDIDKDLAEDFMNLVHNGEIVKFAPRKDNIDGVDCVDDNGIVYIYYENTPNDIFIICHEMLHKLNEQKAGVNLTRDYFGEAVSIMGEMLIGKHLLENGVITTNDFNMRRLKRLNGDKEFARNVIIEGNLLFLKQSGKEINYNNLLDLINSLNDDVVKMVLLDESNDLRRINSILKKYNEYVDRKKCLVDVLSLRKSQRYIIAECLTSEIIGKENEVGDFLDLHYAVRDKDSDIGAVVDNMRQRHPNL